MSRRSEASQIVAEQDQDGRNVVTSNFRPLVLLARLTGILNAIGTLAILALMILVNSDILGREIFNHPVRGTTEILSLTIVAIVFLQLAHCLFAGRLTRNDALLNRLSLHMPRLSAFIEVIFLFAGAALMAVIFTASLPFFQKAWRINEYVGALGDFTAPTWPVRLIILIGTAITALMFLTLAADKIRRACAPAWKRRAAGDHVNR